MALDNIIGKVVTLTGNDTVGYGSEGNPVLGVVTKIKKAGDTDTYPLGFEGIRQSATFKLDSSTLSTLDSTATDSYVVTVEFGRMFEDIPITATAEKQPAVGNSVTVDGAGALVKYTATIDTTTGDAYADLEVSTPIQALTAYVTSVDTSNNVSTLRVL